MKKIFYLISLFSLGVGMNTPFFLQAQTSTTSLKTEEKTTPTATKTDSQKQEKEAAWVIESAQVAKDYVEGLDKGEYEQSWTKADQLFQHTITQKEWVTALNENRKNLGKVKSRTLKDQRIAWNPHNLPKGAYMVVEYNTSFENTPNSGELLTLRHDPDGKWRVLTYQVN